MAFLYKMVNLTPYMKIENNHNEDLPWGQTFVTGPLARLTDGRKPESGAAEQA